MPRGHAVRRWGAFELKPSRASDLNQDGPAARTRCAPTTQTQDLRLTVAECLAKTGLPSGTADAAT